LYSTCLAYCKALDWSLSTAKKEVEEEKEKETCLFFE
jgi:hypothetical protein